MQCIQLAEEVNTKPASDVLTLRMNEDKLAKLQNRSRSQLFQETAREPIRFNDAFKQKFFFAHQGPIESGGQGTERAVG